MRPPKEDWPKRGPNEWLTPDEIAGLKAAWHASRPTKEVAREYGCSTRVVNKYFAQFQGRFPDRKRPSKRSSNSKPQPAPKPDRPPIRPNLYRSNFEPS